MDDIVSRSDRIYRLVLYVYPRAFRDEYGEEMAQTMRDQVRDAWSTRRTVGVIAVWMKVLSDTAGSAFSEHLKQGWNVSFSWRGLGFGLATAIGFPLAIVSLLAWSEELVGVERAESWSHPAVAGVGFVLAGIGLHALYKRLEIHSTIPIRAVWVGVALGLFGLTDIHALTGGELFGLLVIPASFVLVTFGLATMGRTALRQKTFGALSFVPLAAAASGGLWFLLLIVATGEYRDAMRNAALLLHIALWLGLGAILGADPPRNTESVPADKAPVQAPTTTATDTTPGTTSRKRLSTAAAIFVVLAALLWWLNSPTVVEIATAEITPEGEITAEVNSCGGELGFDVYEDDGLVLVEVVDHRTWTRLSTEDCRDVIHISLSVPLGTRTLVDRATSEPVPLS